MKIACRKCKSVQELDDKTAVCPNCRTILRRCVDCTQYDVRVAFCKAVNKPIPVGERDYPTFAAPSTTCRSYTPTNPVAD